MKKTLLTILCVLTALCGMAQSERTYTEQLVITTGEESSDPQEASILVVDNGDQTINFVLKNFILSSGGSDIPVGNIVVNNLPVTKGEDDLDHVSYDGRISITPGDLDGVVSWFGPMFGQIPIVLEGKMNEEKLYVSIDINIGGSIVNVLLGTDDFFVTRIYTEPTIILAGDGEPSEPYYEANVTVIDRGNQTIDFVLKNFMLPAEKNVIPVGNIVIENIPVSRPGDGLDYVFYQGVITIESGDLGGYSYWLGPDLGDIPVVLNAKMDEQKLFATIDINMDGTVVKVQVGTDFISVIIVTGDLNGDAAVDIADAVSVLNIMSEGGYSQVADINGDDKVDIADFVGILDIMAEQ